MRPIAYEARLGGFRGLTFVGTLAAFIVEGLAFLLVLTTLLLPLSQLVSRTFVRTRLLPLLGRVVNEASAAAIASFKVCTFC